MPRPSSYAALRPVVALERPRPPTHLSNDAKRIWRAVVEAQRAGHFGVADLFLLETFAVTMVSQRIVAQRLQDALEAGDRAAEERQHTDLIRLAKCASDLATKLRICANSRSQRDEPPEQAASKPWLVA